MDSDEDESLDDQPTVCDDSALGDRVKSLLTNLATGCRRQQVGGRLPELQPYRDCALGAHVDGQAHGSQGDRQMFQNEPGIEAGLLPDVQGCERVGDILPVVQHASDMLCAVQDQGCSNELVDVVLDLGHLYKEMDGVQTPGLPDEAVDVFQAPDLPSESLHALHPPEHSSGTVAAVCPLSCDAETQTSIVSEGWKETSDPITETSILPDVIYSSSESVPTSPDILSNGAFNEQQAGNHDLEETSKQSCSGAAAERLSSMTSDDGLRQNESFSSAIGRTDSQRSDAGREKVRLFSSGYATQSSRQSENSLLTSCDDGSSVFLSAQENARDGLIDPSVLVSLTDETSSLENLSSSETVLNWPGSSQKGPSNSCHGNLPDFDRLLSDEELISTTRVHGVRDLLEEASGILESSVAIEDENAVVEIPDGSINMLALEGASRMSDETWDLEMEDWQLRDYALELINEGLDLIEVEQNLLERLDDLPAENFAAEEDGTLDFTSWSEETKRNCIGHLHIAAACGDKDCGDDRCLFFQDLLSDLEDHLRNRTLLYSKLHLQLLRGIAEHSVVCAEIRCAIPWCLFFSRGDFDEPEEQISRLLSLYSAFDLGVTREIKVTESDAVKHIQLDEATNWPSIESGSKRVPEPETDFEFLSPCAKFGRISFYALSLNIVPKLLYVETQSAIDDMYVWNRMRGLQHPNIVHLLWAYVSHSQTVICSDALTYGDKSLEDVMKENRSGLPRADFVQFSSGILLAAEYLNKSHVLYLLWTADSVGLMGDGRTVRLRDFSCAVDEGRAASDDGELADLLCSALPPIIISPEMFANDIGRHSDVWGIGCLLFHLVHGLTVHHDLRHCHLDQIRTTVQQVPFVSMLRSIQNGPVHNILRRVFVEKSRRIPIEQLREQVLQLPTS